MSDREVEAAIKREIDASSSPDEIYRRLDLKLRIPQFILHVYSWTADQRCGYVITTSQYFDESCGAHRTLYAPL